MPNDVCNLLQSITICAIFMQNNAKQDMAKMSRTFRISEEVNKQLTQLSETFNESGGEIVERAIQFLFENREEQLKKDNAARISKLRST